MDTMGLLSSLFRWTHIIAGITWIGLLYFFNWVNGPFAKTMDGETKQKVVPELLPRALYWFRWGAAWTWVSGVLLLLLVFYHKSGAALFDSDHDQWTILQIVLVAVTFLSLHGYDVLVKSALKTPAAHFFGGVVWVAVFSYAAMELAHFQFRGTAIHIGAMFGTWMAFNVWFRIWPAQQRIIRAIKNGEAPDPADPALAGLRSKHNTYMSVPLVFMMINQHSTWAATWYWPPIVVAAGWLICSCLYKKAGAVKGF